jgi:predicted amidohydrolase YtcJ
MFLIGVFLLAACVSATPQPTETTGVLSPSQTASPAASPVPIVDPAQPVQKTNLALGKLVTASNTRPDNPAALAVDGIDHSENFWSSGAEPEQWIEIDLGAASDIYEVRLIVFQHPPGESLHRVLGRAARGDEFQELHVFEAFTEDGQVLSIEPASPWTSLRYIRVETLASAPTAYVEWREIEIIGLPAGTDPLPANEVEADIIFHNGNLLTMEPDQPLASAIAIQEGRILAVGAEEEILALAGALTQIIDLDGLTIMPGFVDPHTHLLKDTELEFEDAQQLALENGITTLTEMTTPPEFLTVLQTNAAEGRLRVRVTSYLQYSDPCGQVAGDWYLEHPVSREFGEMLQISGVKLFADGGVCGLPAVSFEYLGGQGRGDLWFMQEEMDRAVAAIHASGYQVAIHAQGDRAIEQAQNAIEFALAGEENIPRHRIEHNSFHRADLLPRYSEIGIVATIFGAYPTCAEINESAVSNFFGAEQMSWLENWRDFVDANPGLHIAWHGDDPWVVPISPIIEMYSLVTRKQVDQNGAVCEPPVWLSAHALTVQEVLPMMTIEAAYALFREDEVGSLAPGKFADLLILSGNPLDDPDAIKDIEIWVTMVGGQVEYCAAPDPALCLSAP